MPQNEKVFISYSWDSKEHCAMILEFADKLRSDGIDAEIDQYVECPEEGWPRWMNKQIRDSEFVLCICTETYCKRINGEEVKDEGLGVTWEGGLIYQRLYTLQGKNSKFIPIILKSSDKDNIPEPLRDTTIYSLENYNDYDKLYARLIGEPLAKKPELGKRKPLPEKQVKTHPDLFLATPIDITLWNKAKWNGVAYSYAVNELPIMLFCFTNEEPALQIFGEWVNRYGKTDKEDEIRISIIEGDIPHNTENPGYSVHVNSNYENIIHKLEKSGLKVDGKAGVFCTIGRFHRMQFNGNTSKNLNIFKSLYNELHSYYIAPAVFNKDTGELTPYYDYKILKKEIIFRDTTDIQTHDIDYIVMKPHDKSMQALFDEFMKSQD